MGRGRPWPRAPPRRCEADRIGSRGPCPGRTAGRRATPAPHPRGATHRTARARRVRTRQVRSGCTMRATRARVRSSNVCPPRKGQNCLGRSSPAIRRVNGRSRDPSPPARMIAHRSGDSASISIPSSSSRSAWLGAGRLVPLSNGAAIPCSPWASEFRRTRDPTDVLIAREHWAMRRIRPIRGRHGTPSGAIASAFADASPVAPGLHPRHVGKA